MKSYAIIALLAASFLTASPQQSHAQMEDNLVGIFYMSTMFGGIMPAAPILLDMGAIWGLVSVPTGVGVLYVGLVNESSFAAYTGTSFLLGGTYLLMSSEHKPSRQFLSNYAIWIATGIAFSGTEAFTEGSFQPYITPNGAGFRYRF
jgi:Na+-transporting NADH:ubiquinone oxidoreductase subunit NqrB